MNEEILVCELCKRPVPKRHTTKHHVVPKSLKGKETIVVCRPCGDQVHKLFTLREMKNKFHTVEAILNDERMQKWVKWIRKTYNIRVCMKAKKRR